MRKHNILYFIILFFANINLLHSADIAKTRRFDADFYQNSYSGDLKYKLEKQNENTRDLEIIQVRKPIKNGKYEGYYKVGTPYTVLGQKYYPREDVNYEEVGMASWYGGEFHNRKTANGETYNMDDFTAAHRTLPMPCVVRITNIENGKSIKVRVNDRGPFAKNRIIDVSKKVAKHLDFHEKGTIKVRVKYLKKDTDKLLNEYGLK